MLQDSMGTLKSLFDYNQFLHSDENLRVLQTYQIGIAIEPQTTQP